MRSRMVDTKASYSDEWTRKRSVPMQFWPPDCERGGRRGTSACRASGKERDESERERETHLEDASHPRIGKVPEVGRRAEDGRVLAAELEEDGRADLGRLERDLLADFFRADLRRESEGELAHAMHEWLDLVGRRCRRKREDAQR